MRIISYFLILLATHIYCTEPIEIIESVPAETILDNNDIRDAAIVWPELFNAAIKSIDIEQFYISNKPGEAMELVIKSIENAAARNIEVRIIADANMAKTYPETLERLNKSENINVHLFNLKALTGGTQHSKYFIIDGAITFFGSQNFDWRALSHIHELGLLIRSEALSKEYQQVFNQDWEMSKSLSDGQKILSQIAQEQYEQPVSSYTLHSEKYGTIITIPTFSSFPLITNPRQSDESQIIELINSAQDSVKLQFLSYSPGTGKDYYPALDRAIRNAADRGVLVKMILSDWMSGRRMPAIQALQQIPGITIRLTTIPEHSSGYISYGRVEHCKFIIADERSFWLGTSNGNKDYFHNGRNLGIIIQNSVLCQRMNQIFLKSWNSIYANPVDPDKIYSSKYYGGE